MSCSQALLNYLHHQGTIEYCENYFWKKIQDNGGKVVYESNKCWCIRNENFHRNSFVEICKKTNTISYSCKNCLISNKHVKHIYLYPKKNQFDYDPFYSCPFKEKAKSIPSIHKELFCINCNSIEENCKTIGLIWMCYKCTKDQLHLFTRPLGRMNIDKFKPLTTSSGVCWTCARCFCSNVSFFNNSMQENRSFKCSYYNH